MSYLDGCQNVTKSAIPLSYRWRIYEGTNLIYSGFISHDHKIYFIYTLYYLICDWRKKIRGDEIKIHLTNPSYQYQLSNNSNFNFAIHCNHLYFSTSLKSLWFHYKILQTISRHISHLSSPSKFHKNFHNCPRYSRHWKQKCSNRTIWWNISLRETVTQRYSPNNYSSLQPLQIIPSKRSRFENSESS